jgi:hypothetical protein
VKIIIFLDKKKEFFFLAKGGFGGVNGQKKAKKYIYRGMYLSLSVGRMENRKKERRKEGKDKLNK